MTEQIDNGTLKLICDVPFLKKTKDELTAIFTQKFIEDVTNGYVFRPSSPGKPPVVVTISEVVAGTVKEQIDAYVLHCMALVTKERVIAGTLDQPKKKRAPRKKSTSKKPSAVTPKVEDTVVETKVEAKQEIIEDTVVETEPTLVDPTDNDSSNTPDMYKDLDGSDMEETGQDGFGFDEDQDK